MLGGAWEQYKEALSTGTVLELEAKYESFVATVLDDVITVEVENEAA